MKSVIVIGTGPQWKEELLGLLTDAGHDVDIMAVNSAIAECPVPITHAVSKHPTELKEWINDHPSARAHSIRNDFGFRFWDFDYPWMEINSGLFAVKVAIELEYDRIFVVGMPCTHPGSMIPLRSRLQEIADEFNNVVIPNHYWWKEFVNGDNDD